MNRKQQNMESLNIGGSSILVIFVLLCLVTFAALALTSALSSYRLAERVAIASDEYFAADGYAEEILAQISALIRDADSDIAHIHHNLSSIIDNAVFEPTGAGTGIISYYVYISATRTLNIELEVNLYDNSNRVIMWQVVNVPMDYIPRGPMIIH